MSNTLKALSIKQPWARLILHHGKDVENRTWQTRYRGPLIIHASQQPDRYYPDRIANVGEDIPTRVLLSLDVRTGGACGALVGVVDLVDVVQGADSPWAEPDPPGKTMWHWVLDNPRPLPAPVEWSGALSVWEIAREDLEQALEGSEQLLLPSEDEVTEEDALRMLLDLGGWQE